jgi:HD-like signal output (HDOD) protein
MNTENHQDLIAHIIREIEQDHLELPTLPDVAVKIQILINDPNVLDEKIIAALSSDPFVIAQIIKSANSAAFSGKPHVDNVKDAASRLGYRQLHNMVITITMNKLFYSTNPAINRRMRQIWARSRKVAAVSYLLASHHPHLSREQAMLAGLMHNIGVLPLCMYIEKQQLMIEDEVLEALIEQCSGIIGTKLLQKWNFSKEIIEVVAGYQNMHRASNLEPKPDYVDLVLFANLQANDCAESIDWKSIATTKRLGLSEQDCLIYIEQNAERIEMVEVLLGMKQEAHAKSNQAIDPASVKSQLAVSSQVEKRVGFLSYILNFLK